MIRSTANGGGVSINNNNSTYDGVDVTGNSRVSGNLRLDAGIFNQFDSTPTEQTRIVIGTSNGQYWTDQQIGDVCIGNYQNTGYVCIGSNMGGATSSTHIRLGPTFMNVNCGVTTFTSTQDASGYSNSAISVAGGVYITKNLVVSSSGVISAQNTTNATSTSTGAIVSSGGIATTSGKDIYCGGMYTSKSPNDSNFVRTGLYTNGTADTASSYRVHIKSYGPGSAGTAVAGWASTYDPGVDGTGVSYDPAFAFEWDDNNWSSDFRIMSKVTGTNTNRLTEQMRIAAGGSTAGDVTMFSQTDALSSIAAGVMMKGGLAVAKKVNIGTDLTVGGNIIYANQTDYQHWISSAKMEGFPQANWTRKADASNVITLNHTPADETVYVSVDCTEPIRTTSSKGYKLTSLTICYQVLTTALHSTPTVALALNGYSDNAGYTQSAITLTGSMTGSTNVDPAIWCKTMTVSSPSFLNTSNSQYQLEVSFFPQSTTVLKVWGVFLNFTRQDL